MSNAEVGTRRRGRALLILVAGVCIVALLITVGWVAAQRFVSPSQREAAAEPPPAGPITAEVQSGALADSATAAGTFEPESTNEILIPLEGSPSVVTGTPVDPGSSVESGDVVLEVNGRPIIGYAGDFPFYRDLTYGDQGPDVKQLQLALADLGYEIDADGEFGAETSRALKEAYEIVGYEVPTVPNEQEQTADEPLDSSADEPRSVVSSKLNSFRMAEAIVLPEKGWRIAALPRLGTVLDGESAITISSASIVVEATASDVVEAFVAPGSEVTLTTPSSKAVGGIVKSVERGEDDNWIIICGPADELFQADWSGKETVITMTVTKAPEGSLIVPSSAVIAAGASEWLVLKSLPDGTFRSVPVTEVAQLSGRSAIQPLDGNLSSGDIVRIG